MCGITGIYSFEELNSQEQLQLDNAVKSLYYRGPDSNGIYKHQNTILGHSRLSIIDTSNAANQPFTDQSGRYTIVFNGEIFNFKTLKENLKQQDVNFISNSDTEVVLYLYITKGKDFLNDLNGFFAFAIYDKEERSLFAARDRYGVKPLLYYYDEQKFVFASEMKTILCYGLPKQIDNTSLYTYIQLNYTVCPNTIFQDIKKLEAGHYLYIKNNRLEEKQYYSIPKNYLYFNNNISPKLPEYSINYENAQNKLRKLLDKSVEQRLIADVPLGAFLSGGIDSSIIVSIASKFTDKLKTFSVGYKDEPLFDETYYAELVAKKFNTEHTTFKLSNNDFFEHFYNILDYIDEPFADSSAIAVYILSHYTRKHLTVAISGDGADEMFGGYVKHRGEYFLRNNTIQTKAISSLGKLWQMMPQSRNTKFGNLFRQLNKMSKGAELGNKQRYWLWCGFQSEDEAKQMLNLDFDMAEYNKRKKNILSSISEHPNKSLNEVFYTDMQLVLLNDMLTKVDMMSMANSLEIRTPFLDYNLVDFAFSLPANFKIDEHQSKKILRDTYRSVLPAELFNHPKHGFEVPLLKWFRTELKSKITDDYLNPAFIKEQDIFNPAAIEELKDQLFKSSNGDIVPQIWALIVFQHWYKRYFS